MAVRSRMIALALLIGLAAFGLLGWMVLDARKLTLEAARTTTQNLAAALEQHAARTIETVDLALSVVINRVESPRVLGKDADAQEIHRVLSDRIADAPQIRSVVVLDARGDAIHDAGAFPARRFNAAESDFFKVHRDRDDIGLYIGTPVRNRITGKWMITLSRRVNEADGGFKGVVVAVLDPGYFQDFYGTMNIGTAGNISLFLTDGSLLVREPVDEGYIGHNYRNSELFAKHLPQSLQGSFEAVSEFDGMARIIGYKQVFGLPLVVAVGLARDEILAQWWHQTMFQITLGLALAVIGAGLTVMLYRELNRRERAERKIKAAAFEIEKARQAADKANRAKSEFLASMSHELRTPLNAILGFSEVIHRSLLGAPSVSRYREYGGLIHESGLHLLSLINDILDLAKIEARKLDLHEEVVDLEQMLRSVVLMVSEKAQANGLNLELRPVPGSVAIRGDARLLKQSFLNLLSNAVKFTPGGGDVTVSTELSDQGVSVSVADTGIGIKETDLQRVFEPFEQIDSLIARQHQGSGLGMPLTRSFIELHGGRVSIQSAEGKGTIVTVQLPANRLVESSPEVIDVTPERIRA
jgi:signal transduction histidine kinase